METRKLYRNWIEIDTSAIKHNYSVFRNIIDPKCKLMAVVKSNAYGHDADQFAKLIESMGADYLGADSITEALAFRQTSISIPILVLGYTLPDRYTDAFQNNIEITLSSLEQIRAASRSGVNLKVHMKIDTGMHRQGLQDNEIEEAIKLLKESKNIETIGIYTHFAAAKNPAFPSDTKKQLDKFKTVCAMFKDSGFDLIQHSAATSGTLLYPESHMDMVRIGIGLYGYWPSIETREAKRDKIILSPALSWKATISEIKNIKAGERVGYDFTESLSGDGKIAIIPVGYWHGYSRSFSGIGRVKINDKYAKVLGRVSMDMVTVDVSGIDCAVGDEVILLGGEGQTSVYHLADITDGSWYELITRLNPLIKREYL